MDWLEVGKKVAGVGLPLLGTVIGGPGGGAIGTALAGFLDCKTDSPQEVAEKIENATPEEISKMNEFQLKHRERLVELQIKKAEIESNERLGSIQAVNASMQEETKLGHKWAGAWRPFWGFLSAIGFGIALLGIFILTGIAIYTKQLEFIKTIPDLTFNLSILFAIPGSILGVASWHRGQMQRVQSGEQKNGLTGIINLLKK